MRKIVLDQAQHEIRIDQEVEKALKNYEWPGNARELLNVLEGIISFMDGDVIRLRDLVFHLNKNRRHSNGSEYFTLRNARHQAEEDAIRYALAATNNNKAHASGLLGIHRTLLYKKMKKFNIPIN